MLYRLKSLELQGYKTFASRTVFDFSGMITAIVGPNGSGKSNIADSIRWVLGEQSYSLLRGKRTEDMIYTGSDLRSRSGMASATITFDNSDGWLPIDYSEVAITRRAYRDGHNEYLLNGQKVRLKDVSELLAHSGLAERTYTIIGQGLVDTALSLRADERKRLFEEAAGIGLHRARREEALRRLDATHRNIERVQDILVEIKPRLRSLEKQANRAQELHLINRELHTYLREWYGYLWNKSQDEVNESAEISKIQEKKLIEHRKNYLDISQKGKKIKDQIQEVRNILDLHHGELSDLHRQSEVLNRNIAINGEKESYLRKLIENHQADINRQLEGIQVYEEKRNSLKEEISLIVESISEAQLSRSSINEKYLKKTEEIKIIENNISVLRSKMLDFEAELNKLEILKNERKIQYERNLASVELINRSITENESKGSEEQEIIDQFSIELLSNQIKLNQLNDLSDRLLSKKIIVSNDIRERRSEIDNFNSLIIGGKAQLEILQQAESNLEGYSEGSKLIHATYSEKYKDYYSFLIQQLTVPSVYEEAISAALGDFSNAVIIKNESNELLMFDFFNLLVDNNKNGVLIPLADTHFTTNIKLPEGFGKNYEIASDLINYPDYLTGVMKFLLGNVLVVDNWQIALDLVAWIKNNLTVSTGSMINQPLRVATLAGELFYLNGAIITKGTSQENQTAISRKNIIKKLVNEINNQNKLLEKQSTQNVELQGELEDIENKIANLNVEKNYLDKEIDQKNREVRQHKQNITALDEQNKWFSAQILKIRDEIYNFDLENNQIEQNISQARTDISVIKDHVKGYEKDLTAINLLEIQAELNMWDTQMAVDQRAMQELTRRSDELSIDIKNLESERVVYEEKLRENRVALEELLKNQEEWVEQEKSVSLIISNLQKKIDPAETKLSLLERELSELAENEFSAQQLLNSFEDQYSQARINLIRRQESLETLRRRIEDDFGLVEFNYGESVTGPTPLPLEGYVEQLPIVSQVNPELEDAIRRLRAQIRRIGPVNPESVEEYNEVKQRFEFLTDQINDLGIAEADIQKVILELDHIMEQEFQQTFSAVDTHFREIFVRLFGGGSAQLILTDPENVTDTGVEIVARLPGRRAQGLSLLSGGERSLTAVALIFALLKVSPTPFCLLDEVDAMLDEENVNRFRELLRELGDNTQFIIVTHNRNTVQVADIIYGITLGRDLSSQVLSIMLDQVSNLVPGE